MWCVVYRVESFFLLSGYHLYEVLKYLLLIVKNWFNKTLEAFNSESSVHFVVAGCDSYFSEEGRR